MTRALRTLTIAASFLVALWAFAPAAQAYLDPGAGSILLQTIVGGVAVVGGVLAHYWSRVRRLLRGSADEAPLTSGDGAGSSARGDRGRPDA